MLLSLLLLPTFLFSTCLGEFRIDTRYKWKAHCGNQPSGPRDLQDIAKFLKAKEIYKVLIGEYDLAVLSGDELKLVPYRGNEKFPMLCPWRIKKPQPRKTKVIVNIVSKYITDLGDEYDTIVNPTNEGCLEGSGVDGAIRKAAGANLTKACRSIPIVKDGFDPKFRNDCRCRTGDARITKGFKLCDLIIHTVGPRYSDFTSVEAKRMLFSSIVKVLTQANRFNSKRIAIPPISMDSFGQAGAEVICGAIKVMLTKYPHNRFRRISIVLNPDARNHDELKRYFKSALENHDLL